MTNEEREKEIRKQPIPTKEECLAFYKELVKLADVRFVPYHKMAIEALEQQPSDSNISAPCDGCQYELNSTNGNPCYSCGKYKLTEQQLCEDCISREQTLKAFAEKCGGECACCEYNGSGYDTAENCKLIKSMPSVTPSRPRGRWVSHREHCEILGVIPNGLGAYEWCSNCDCGIDGTEFHRNYYNFCPCCGADMRGKSDDT